MKMRKYVVFVEEDFLKSCLEIRIIKNLEIIFITPVNIEAQGIVFGTKNLTYPIKFL